ncbi:unnamed protein product [Trichogramma brassicae]|uniref:Uncharacterized protein n=1 Tax=Trichogramma brassicae TaxID=86971 RepID=A0A6H5I0Z2_9HYME|nr:unnamed protein product [Trichogramma brassicae]
MKNEVREAPRCSFLHQDAPRGVRRNLSANRICSITKRRCTKVAKITHPTSVRRNDDSQTINMDIEQDMSLDGFEDTQPEKQRASSPIPDQLLQKFQNQPWLDVSGTPCEVMDADDDRDAGSDSEVDDDEDIMDVEDERTDSNDDDSDCSDIEQTVLETVTIPDEWSSVQLNIDADIEEKVHRVIIVFLLRIFEVRFFAWCGRACVRGGAGTTQKKTRVMSSASEAVKNPDVRAGSDRITINRSPRRGLTKLAIDGAQHSHHEVRSEKHTHKRAPDAGAKAQQERMMAPEARTTLTR